MDHLFSRYKTNNFIIRITNIHLLQASLRILAQNTKLVANILGKDYESLDKNHHNEETNRNLFQQRIYMICPNGSPIDHQQNRTYPLLLNFVEDIG